MGKVSFHANGTLITFNGLVRLTFKPRCHFSASLRFSGEQGKRGEGRKRMKAATAVEVLFSPSGAPKEKGSKENTLATTGTFWGKRGGGAAPGRPETAPAAPGDEPRSGAPALPRPGETGPDRAAGSRTEPGRRDAPRDAPKRRCDGCCRSPVAPRVRRRQPLLSHTVLRSSRCHTGATGAVAAPPSPGTPLCCRQLCPTWQISPCPPSPTSSSLGLRSLGAASSTGWKRSWKKWESRAAAMLPPVAQEGSRRWQR